MSRLERRTHPVPGFGRVTCPCRVTNSDVILRGCNGETQRRKNLTERNVKSPPARYRIHIWTRNPQLRARSKPWLQPRRDLEAAQTSFRSILGIFTPCQWEERPRSQVHGGRGTMEPLESQSKKFTRTIIHPCQFNVYYITLALRL